VFQLDGKTRTAQQVKVGQQPLTLIKADYPQVDA
jgi:hypothetical protein